MIRIYVGYMGLTLSFRLVRNLSGRIPDLPAGRQARFA